MYGPVPVLRVVQWGIDDTDPLEEVRDIGVNTRIAGISTADAPRDNSGQFPGTDKRATGVALAGIDPALQESGAQLRLRQLVDDVAEALLQYRHWGLL